MTRELIQKRVSLRSAHSLEGSLQRSYFEFQQLKGRPKFLSLGKGQKPEYSLINLN